MKLIAKTEHGTFTRTTSNQYAFVVVRRSDRTMEAVNQVKPWGVRAKWAKDNGYAVTWHKSIDSAETEMRKAYVWDREAVVLGMYPVDEA